MLLAFDITRTPSRYSRKSIIPVQSCKKNMHVAFLKFHWQNNPNNMLKDEYNLLECDAVCSGSSLLLNFWRNMLPPSSELKSKSSTAQPLSCWLLTMAVWVQSQASSWHGDRQVFCKYFGFPCQFSFHELLYFCHQSSGTGTIGQLRPTYQWIQTHPKIREESGERKKKKKKGSKQHSTCWLLGLQFGSEDENSMLLWTSRVLSPGI